MLVWCILPALAELPPPGVSIDTLERHRLVASKRIRERAGDLDAEAAKHPATRDVCSGLVCPSGWEIAIDPVNSSRCICLRAVPPENKHAIKVLLGHSTGRFPQNAMVSSFCPPTTGYKAHACGQNAENLDRGQQTYGPIRIEQGPFYEDACESLLPRAPGQAGCARTSRSQPE